MAVSHVFSNAVANWTGTATVFNSQGSTTTVAATALVRPQDWNSVHNQFSTLTGNTSLNSTASGTNIVLQGVGGITLVGSTNTIGISANPGVTYQYFDPYNEAPEIYLPMTNGTIFVDPQQMPNIQHDRIGIRMFYTNNAAETNDFRKAKKCFDWIGDFFVLRRSLYEKRFYPVATSQYIECVCYHFLGSEQCLDTSGTSDCNYSLDPNDYRRGLLGRTWN